MFSDIYNLLGGRGVLDKVDALCDVALESVDGHLDEVLFLGGDLVQWVMHGDGTVWLDEVSILCVLGCC